MIFPSSLHPHGSPPREFTIFAPPNVRNVIGWLQFGKPKDHVCIGSGRIHTCSWHLAPIATITFNRAIMNVSLLAGQNILLNQSSSVEIQWYPSNYWTIVIGDCAPPSDLTSIEHTSVWTRSSVFFLLESGRVWKATLRCFPTKQSIQGFKFTPATSGRKFFSRESQTAIQGHV